MHHHRLIRQVVRVPDDPKILGAHQQAVLDLFLAVIVALGHIHGLGPGGRIGQGGNGHIVFSLGDAAQYRRELQGYDAALYPQGLRDQLGQLNVRAHVFFVPFLGGVDELAGSKVGLRGHLDIPPGLDLLQPVGAGRLGPRRGLQAACAAHRRLRRQHAALGAGDGLGLPQGRTGR